MLYRGTPKRILAWSRPVDMRKSFDGLLGVIKSVLKEEPVSETLFVFVNRRCNYLKAIYWDRTGYLLFAKRLESGKFKLPQSEEKQELDGSLFRLLLDGIKLGKRSRM